MSPENESERNVILQRLRKAIASIPHELQPIALEWLFEAVNGDETDRGLFEGVMDGTFELSINADGEARFKLTPLGHERSLDILHRSAEMRDLFNRMTGGPVLSDPPKKTQ